jgi:hypothetical protein
MFSVSWITFVKILKKIAKTLKSQNGKKTFFSSMDFVIQS